MNTKTIVEILSTFSRGQGNPVHPAFGKKPIFETSAIADAESLPENFCRAVVAMEIWNNPELLEFYKDGFFGSSHKKQAEGDIASSDSESIEAYIDRCARLALLSQVSAGKLIDQLETTGKINFSIKVADKLDLLTEEQKKFVERRKIEEQEKLAQFAEITNIGIEIESVGQTYGRGKKAVPNCLIGSISLLSDNAAKLEELLLKTKYYLLAESTDRATRTVKLVLAPRVAENK